MDLMEMIEKRINSDKKKEKKEPKILGKLTPEELKKWEASLNGGKELKVQFVELFKRKIQQQREMQRFWLDLRDNHNLSAFVDDLHVVNGEIHDGNSNVCLCPCEEQVDKLLEIEGM